VSPEETVLKPALRLLSARARSVKELRERLLKKGLDPSHVSRCILWLEERDLLNDGAFARSFLRDRIRFAPRSPFLLERELKEKGVPPSLAVEAVEETLDEERVSAEDLSVMAAEAWVRKQGSDTRRELLANRFTPEGDKVRRRLFGFLARRGFVGDAARRGLDAGMEKARELEG